MDSILWNQNPPLESGLFWANVYKNNTNTYGSMEVKTLLERLDELPDEFGMSLSRLSIEAGLNNDLSLWFLLSRLRNGRDIQFSKVDQIAKGLDLIAVVFYRGGHVEDLGHPRFIYGEAVYNYVGQVFSNYRRLLKRTQAEFGGQIGISDVVFSNYENGTLPMLYRLEVIAGALGLVPNYLVQKKESPTTLGSP